MFRILVPLAYSLALAATSSMSRGGGPACPGSMLQQSLCCATSTVDIVPLGQDCVGIHYHGGDRMLHPAGTSCLRIISRDRCCPDGKLQERRISLLRTWILAPWGSRPAHHGPNTWTMTSDRKSVV